MVASRRASLEDAITAVAAQASAQGVSLTRTKVVKLLYFVDLAAWSDVGRTVTGVEWIWHNYGPYSSTIVEAVSSMGSEDELELTASYNYYGSREYQVQSKAPAYYRPISSDLTRLVRTVVRDFGKLRPSEIGDASYDTAPMKELMSSGGVRGDRIEFRSEAPTKSQVESTLSRYAGLVAGNSSGDEGDIATGLREEAIALDGARRSSNSDLLPHA